jgi:hypothetical protein
VKREKTKTEKTTTTRTASIEQDSQWNQKIFVGYNGRFKSREKGRYGVSEEESGFMGVLEKAE